MTQKEQIRIPYGRRERLIKLSSEKLMSVLEPLPGEPITDLGAEIRKGLVAPTTGPPLYTLVNERSKVVIIVDDNTRPTPTKEVLPPILSTLDTAGVHDENITIIFALGAHKKLNAEEKAALVGDEVYQRFRCINHEVDRKEALLFLGETSFGTPVVLNKQVYEADLRILTGLIKPHNQAGFSGGGKSILPGVCGFDTISSNHSYKSISDPRSCLGMIEGNPIRRDIEETLQWVGPCFLVNLVLNYREDVVGVVTGDPLAAHREGVKILSSLSECLVPKKADICLCGTPNPIDINFYQMLNSLSAPYRLFEPIINPGGTIIVAGRALQGVSDGDFHTALKTYHYAELWKLIKNDEHCYRERPALQIFLEGALNYKFVVVSEFDHVRLFKEMGIEFREDMQTAVDSVIKNYPGESNVLVLPYAPYVIPKLKQEYE